MMDDLISSDSVLKEQILHKAQWLSWLERRPVTAEVTGSSPVWVVDPKGSLFIENNTGS